MFAGRMRISLNWVLLLHNKQLRLNTLISSVCSPDSWIWNGLVWDFDLGHNFNFELDDLKDSLVLNVGMHICIDMATVFKELIICIIGGTACCFHWRVITFHVFL